VTVWVFVGVRRELGTCVLHLSLNGSAETFLAIIRACILTGTTFDIKCDISEKVDVIFHEVIKHKIIGHIIHFCKQQFKMHWILNECIHCYNNNFFFSKYTLMFNLSVFTRVLQMNNFMYRVMNADILLIYVGLTVHFYVKFVIRHSVKRAIW